MITVNAAYDVEVSVKHYNCLIVLEIEYGTKTSHFNAICIRMVVNYDANKTDKYESLWCHRLYSSSVTVLRTFNLYSMHAIYQYMCMQYIHAYFDETSLKYHKDKEK